MFFARPAFASRLPDFGAEHAGKRLVFGGKRTQNKQMPPLCFLERNRRPGKAKLW